MDININLLRSLVTVVAFAAFIGILLWAYRPANQKRFEEAAHLPFSSEQEQGP